MSLQASVSETWNRFRQKEPPAYDRLAEPVRRWIWDQGWGDLRDIQKQAIPAILEGGDVIVSAATASGKTEAAMLPLISRTVDAASRAKAERSGFAIAYIGPLKALINDQFSRIESLCERAGLPVHPWHGDVGDATKGRARKNPGGIVLITPESLEANLVRRGTDVQRLFASLDAIVIDELHAFIGTERGVHLQSLMHRLDVIAGRPIDRVGLSATLGDMSLAAECLRPGGGGQVRLVDTGSRSAELRTQLRAYRVSEDDTRNSIDTAIAQHLFEVLRGKRNLVFAGSRAGVELFTGKLEELSDRNGITGEFVAHHGSLSREHRQEVEARLRNPGPPVTAVCTSTLEMGIDIGDVDAVAQIGPPSTVAALKQRLGRSGRRAGQPAVLRTYVVTAAADGDAPVWDRLQFDLVRTIAMLGLLIDGWCEAPPPRGLHLSTLAHQILSLIAQHDGLHARQLFDLLCRNGPFSNIDQDLFAEVLRSLGASESRLIEQADDGTLLLGERGELLVGDHGFFTVFDTAETFRVTHKGSALGQVARISVATSGGTIVLGGQSWTVRSVDERSKVIDVVPGGAGKPQMFGRGETNVDDRIAAAMHEMYESEDVPAFLDEVARDLLMHAREAYAEAELTGRFLVEHEDEVLLLPWVGTRALRTLALALKERGLTAQVIDPICRVRKSERAEVILALEKLIDDPVDPVDLMSSKTPAGDSGIAQHLTGEKLYGAMAQEQFDMDQLSRTCRRLLDMR